MSIISPASARAEIHSKLSALLQRALSTFAAADVDEAVAGAIGSALKADAERIARLAPSGDLGRAATEGTWPHEKWVAYAAAQWDDINAQLRYLGQAEETWNRFWDEVVSQSGTDLVSALPSKPEAFAGLSLVVVGLVALAVIVVMR